MKNKKKLIYADDLKNLVNTDINRMYALRLDGVGLLYRFLDQIDQQPAVDAVEVVHGRWKFLDIDGWWFDECSICGDTTPNHDGSPPGWNYCPNCGAKMDLECQLYGL